MPSCRHQRLPRAMRWAGATVPAGLPLPAFANLDAGPLSSSPVGLYAAFAIAALVVVALLLWEALSDHSQDDVRRSRGSRWLHRLRHRASSDSHPASARSRRMADEGPMRAR